MAPAERESLGARAPACHKAIRVGPSRRRGDRRAPKWVGRTPSGGAPIRRAAAVWAAARLCRSAAASTARAPQKPLGLLITTLVVAVIVGGGAWARCLPRGRPCVCGRPRLPSDTAPTPPLRRSPVNAENPDVASTVGTSIAIPPKNAANGKPIGGTAQPGGSTAGGGSSSSNGQVVVGGGGTGPPSSFHSAAERHPNSDGVTLEHPAAAGFTFLQDFRCSAATSAARPRHRSRRADSRAHSTVTPTTAPTPRGRRDRGRAGNPSPRNRSMSPQRNMTESRGCGARPYGSLLAPPRESK